MSLAFEAMNKSTIKTTDILDNATFCEELTKLLNRYDMDIRTNTPDWLLAAMIETNIAAFADMMYQRESARRISK
jgi:Mg2+ and Co2+ transporter CorA